MRGAKRGEEFSRVLQADVEPVYQDWNAQAAAYSEGSLAAGEPAGEKTPSTLSTSRVSVFSRECRRPMGINTADPGLSSPATSSPIHSLPRPESTYTHSSWGCAWSGARPGGIRPMNWVISRHPVCGPASSWKLRSPIKVTVASPSRVGLGIATGGPGGRSMSGAMTANRRRGPEDGLRKACPTPAGTDKESPVPIVSATSPRVASHSPSRTYTTSSDG